MPNFAIIGEGKTDQIVIKALLKGALGDSAEVHVNFVQPKDEPGAHGGWPLVFESLRQGVHADALAYNDFVVIQIDTDRAEERGFDVSYRDGEGERTTQQLIGAVRDKLCEVMNPTLVEFRDRILLAICVHSIECWLFPILTDDKVAEREKGCLEKMNQLLQREDAKPLSNRGDVKDVRAYQDLTRKLERRRMIEQIRRCNASLRVFLDRLECLREDLRANP